MIWLALLVGCWGTEQRQALVEEHVRDEMAEHWAESETAREALIAGDLDIAREQGGLIAERLPVEGVPADLEPYQDRLASHAGALRDATSVDDAAAAFGQMTATCGMCHQAGNVDIARPAEIPPPPGEGLAGEMAAHHYAAKALWSALIRPDPADADAALAALASSPLVPSGTEADSPLPEAATMLEVRVHDLAASIRRADEPEERGRRYGELLTTCAACHVAFRNPG